MHENFKEKMKGEVQLAPWKRWINYRFPDEEVCPRIRLAEADIKAAQKYVGPLAKAGAAVAGIDWNTLDSSEREKLWHTHFMGLLGEMSFDLWRNQSLEQAFLNAQNFIESMKRTPNANIDGATVEIKTQARQAYVAYTSLNVPLHQYRSFQYDIYVLVSERRAPKHSHVEERLKEDLAFSNEVKKAMKRYYLAPRVFAIAGFIRGLELASAPVFYDSLQVKLSNLHPIDSLDDWRYTTETLEKFMI